MKVITQCLIFILMYSVSYADMSSRQFAFSELLSNSDLIVTGYVENIQIETNVYSIHFRIEDCMKGTELSNLIEIEVPLSNGFYIPDEYYLEKEVKYLLFLKYNNNNNMIIVNGYAGVLDPVLKNDIIQLIQAYDSNSKLFSQESSKALQNLFFTFTHDESKKRLLYDLEYYLDSGDEVFLSTLFELDNKHFKIFSILQCGKLKIESMRLRIENLLQNSDDNYVKFHCIVALGDLANVNSLNLILDNLNNSDPGIRTVSIAAAGKIGSQEIVQPLKELYQTEKDIGQRLTIITAICRTSDKQIILNTLKYFQSIESDPIVLSVLSRELRSLEEFVIVNPNPFNEEFVMVNPNPFNPLTIITYSIKEPSHVKLNIYSVTGQKVATLVDRPMSEGNHTVTFDGSHLAAGVYFYRFESSGFSKSGKMLLIK